MILDPWLPVKFEILPKVQTGRLLFAGISYQIVQTNGLSSKALIVWPQVAEGWIAAGLIERSALTPIHFGDEQWLALATDDHYLLPLEAMPKPSGKTEARGFAQALQRTRALAPELDLGSSIYVESLRRFLPVQENKARVADEVILGRYLTGGVEVSCYARDRLARLAPWVPAADLRDICMEAGLPAPPDVVEGPSGNAQNEPSENNGEGQAEAGPAKEFSLPGRRDLQAFLHEHVIDIVQHPERYRALGVDFPGAIVLYGPPGSGKTFAVETLVSYLKWPSYAIDSNSIGSPYIHATGQKIADIFEQAFSHAPCAIVIDEMEAFLADRHGGGQHRLEEVAEFLRLIPEAQKKHVLVIGMTNRIDTIDKAILRRGRFDHLIRVDLPVESEITELIQALLAGRPCEENLSLAGAIRYLVGRPLSDSAFFVREAARLAARSGKAKIDDISIAQALRTMTQAN